METKKSVNMIVSTFNDFETVAVDKSIVEVFDEIKSNKYAESIESYRFALGCDKDKIAKELKSKLPSFTPSGTFVEKRKLDFLNNYSGIVHLDFDNIHQDDLKDLKEIVNDCPYTFASFESPSHGLKVFVKVDTDQNQHKNMFQQIFGFYNKLTKRESDKSIKDIPRLCFVSHDPNLYLNANSQTFTMNNNLSTQQQLEKCLDFTQNKETYQEGNRNNFTHLFCCNANRWGIAESETLNFITANFDLSDEELKATIRSAYANSSEFGKFQITYQLKPDIPIPNNPSKLHYISLDDMILRNQSEPPIPYLWSGIKLGSFGFIFGPSKSGKTTFCENLGLSIATGEQEFFNKPLNEGAKKVLFISMEEYWQPRTERNAKQVNNLKNHSISNFITVNEHFPRLINSKDDWELLKKHITETKAEVVFIDSLSRLYSGSIEDSNLAKELLLKLRELTNELKITLIVIHHTPKQTGRPLTIDSLAGSRVLAQEADFMIGISKSPDGNRYQKEVAFRYAAENDETVTTFIINENAWLLPTNEVTESSLLKESDGRQNDDNMNEVLDCIIELSYENPIIETKQLMSQLVDTKVMSKPTLFKALDKLVSKAKIEKVNKGKYKLLS